jgi:hypothetical protein
MLKPWFMSVRVAFTLFDVDGWPSWSNATALGPTVCSAAQTLGPATKTPCIGATTRPAADLLNRCSTSRWRPAIWVSFLNI